jgi:hypothetical protein
MRHGNPSTQQSTKKPWGDSEWEFGSELRYSEVLSYRGTICGGSSHATDVTRDWVHCAQRPFVSTCCMCKEQSRAWEPIWMPESELDRAKELVGEFMAKLQYA